MKALILAAGLGTRLRPYTDKHPKCLFPILGRPNLDIIIQRLISAGCDEIRINTHHLSHAVAAFLRNRHYPVSVDTIFEPELLGTGGAVKNLSQFWGTDPFFIINGDVVCDADLAEMARFHHSHQYPATLCLVNHPDFNIVGIDAGGQVITFTGPSPPADSRLVYRTLSGIHIADPVLLEFIPENSFYSIIDAYTAMIEKGLGIKAFQPPGAYWNDIGTPQRYQEAVYDQMAPAAFASEFGPARNNPIEQQPIKGDGSDRTWYRLKAGENTLIMADHGIDPITGNAEAASFARIGTHLHRNGLPVPRIISADPYSGLVFVEDLGDLNLETFVKQPHEPNRLKHTYEAIIEKLVELSIGGQKDFDVNWAFQTPHYDVPMILDKECRYFVEAFLNGYLQMNIDFRPLEPEFTALARLASCREIFGFMHRDFQHRNIMVKGDNFFFIDFQSGRIGPITYDLASLLIDPYVDIPEDIKPGLVRSCYHIYVKKRPVNESLFMTAFDACCLTRNLQILGAYAFLSLEKNKPQFQQYIPKSLLCLKRNLAKFKSLDLAGLLDITNRISL